jgi:hypothetical protein
MMQAQRKVPLSFAFGERVRDDTDWHPWQPEAIPHSPELPLYELHARRAKGYSGWGTAD